MISRYLAQGIFTYSFNETLKNKLKKKKQHENVNINVKSTWFAKLLELDNLRRDDTPLKLISQSIIYSIFSHIFLRF